MQVTGSQVNFTSDIPNFFFALVNMTYIWSQRFVEKLAFGRFTFINTDEIFREINRVKTYVHGYKFLLSVLNLIMQLSESFFMMKPDEGDINELKETG